MWMAASESQLRPIALHVDLEAEDRILALARFTVIRPTRDSFDTDVAHLHLMEGRPGGGAPELARSRRGAQPAGEPRAGAVSDLNRSHSRPALREN
jgi:hypothetical protein